MRRCAKLVALFGAVAVMSGCGAEEAPQPAITVAPAWGEEREDPFLDELSSYEESNRIEAVIEKYGEACYVYETYSMTGEKMSGATVSVSPDKVVFLTEEGSVLRLYDGEWTGYDAGSHGLYKVVCVDEEAYGKQWGYLRSLAGIAFDDLTMTDSIAYDGGQAVITRSAELTEEAVQELSSTWGASIEEGDIYRDVYFFVRDDKEFLAEEYGIEKPDGTYIKLGSAACIYGSGIDAGDLFDLASGEERTLTLHIRGKDGSEQVMTETAGEGTEFVFLLPDGYDTVYMDAGYTRELSDHELGEDVEAFIAYGK